MFLTLPLISSQGDSHKAAFEMGYSKSVQAVFFKQVEYYDDRPVIYRANTPAGLATIAIATQTYPSYPNVDTSPEGYSLSIKTPKKIPTELRFEEKGLEFVIVDGRRIGLPRKQPHPYLCRLMGGQHFVQLGWPPTE